MARLSHAAAGAAALVLAGLTPPCAAQDRTPFGAPEAPVLRYDTDYAAVGYARLPQDNPIARLQAELASGARRLAFNPERGYLDAVLAALGIEVASQTLVYSRTSLQTGTIHADTPRAIYFNDDSYVAWVQDRDMLELAAMDSRLGPVFYTLPNSEGPAPALQRETLRCLSCHDTYSLSPGGVPRFLLGSGYHGIDGRQLTHEGRILTTDRTPIRYRWGGWYVTGEHGAQVHLGNMHVRSANELTNLESLRRGNLATLDGLFDTRRYLANTSDIVALLVLQHQAHIQNLITRVNFEVRRALERQAAQDAFTPAQLEELKACLDPLVDAMLFVEAAGFTDPIRGNSGFDAWFAQHGPRDRQGRSLRELDLNSRLFRYPLSYLVYAPAFDALPAPARDYVYRRFERILSGAEHGEAYAHLSAGDRRAVREILLDTRPQFAAIAAAR